jgi:hypothetical protein
MVSAARFLMVLDLRVVNIALPPRLHKSLGRLVDMAFTQGGVTGLYGDAGTCQAGAADRPVQSPRFRELTTLEGAI